MDVTLVVTTEEAQAMISAIAMTHPLVRKLADQVTAQQQQLVNGELHGDIDPQRRPAGAS